MKTVITYATSCALTLYFREGENDLASADWRTHYNTLAEAIAQAEHIMLWRYPGTLEKILIWDSNTGEILAECYADDDEESEDYE